MTAVSTRALMASLCDRENMETGGSDEYRLVLCIGSHHSGLGHEIQMGPDTRERYRPMIRINFIDHPSTLSVVPTDEVNVAESTQSGVIGDDEGGGHHGAQK